MFSALRATRVGRAAGLVVVIAVTAMAMHLTAAAFATTTTNPASSVSSASCFFRATTQSGTTSNSANGVTSVTISSVTMSRSFLLFSVRSNSNRPVGSIIRGELATSTRIDFTRVTDEGSPATINIQWYVVEYNCGISVQRGTTTLSNTTENIAITPVATRAAAFVTVSKTAYASDSSWGSNDPMVAELTSVSNLQIRTDAAASNHSVAWQVIEFTDTTKVRVQRGTTSLANGSGSTTATLATAVDPTRTFILVSARSDPPGNDIGSSMIRAQLTNATTITFDRSVTAYAITEISWEAIELMDGSSVQRGSAAFSAGQGTVNAAITAVTLGRSTAFAPVQIGPGQSAGRTAYTADDIIGAGTATVALSSTTQVTLTRNHTTSTADISWFVVSWGLPY